VSSLRSGFVTLVGRPNVGKSSLVNGFFQRKLLIVSEKPQTTRNRIRCIYTDNDAQIVFCDTPGIHEPKHRLGEVMLKAAIQAVRGVDLVLFVVDAAKGFGKPEMQVAQILSAARCKTFLVINKIDLVEEQRRRLILEKAGERCEFQKVFFTCAITGHGLNTLLEEIKRNLPEGPMFYPENMLTDRALTFQVSEIVREKIFLLTQEEVPHCTAVIVDSIQKRPNGTLYIPATIYVERSSQKGIVIGKNGSMIKQIGTLARAEIEELLDCKVYLDLHVKVKKKWREKDFIILNEVGMRDDLDT